MNYLNLIINEKFNILSTKFEKNKILAEIKISNIINNIYNWKKNRPEDPIRVDEIKNFLIQYNYVPGIIKIWKFNNQYFIYDGLHRFKAAEELFKERNINLIVLFSIFETNNESLIESEFMNINKSVSVPNLYFDSNQELKLIIQDVVKNFSITNRLFSSSSQNPRKPNFNRDIFSNTLYNIFKNYQQPINTIIINEMLEECNYNIKTLYDNESEKYSSLTMTINQSVLDKCKKNNMFLFIYGIEYLKVELDKIINKKLFDDIFNFVS